MSHLHLRRNVHARLQAHETYSMKRDALLRVCDKDYADIESEEDTGVWPCPECRLMSANIRFLVNTINVLSESIRD